MGLLSGTASITRFNVTAMPDEPAFDEAAFKEITPGSQVFERVGFVPFEPEAPYQVGQHRFAFRVRIDRVRADPTLVRERLKEMIKAEKDALGADFIGPRRRKRLRAEAEEEVTLRSTPRSKIIECCIDGTVLYVGSTADAYLGLVLALLREIDVICDFKTPWIDRNDPAAHSEVVDQRESWQSVLGCRFARALLSDSDIVVEPESGAARLATLDATIGLTGAVLGDVIRYVKKGAAILSIKLATADAAFRLDTLSFRISSLRIETEPQETWIDALDARLDRISATWDMLDRAYGRLASSLISGPAGSDSAEQPEE